MRLPTVVLLSCFVTTALADEPAAPDPAADGRKRELAIQAGSTVELMTVARVIGPAALYGAQICEIKTTMAVFEESLATERQIGKESGVVDMQKLHEDGEAIVALKRELADAQASAAKQKVKPAPCSDRLVAAILACGAPECVALEKHEDEIRVYSLPSGAAKFAQQEATFRSLISAKFPDVLAQVGERAAALLAALGLKAP